MQPACHARGADSILSFTGVRQVLNSCVSYLKLLLYLTYNSNKSKHIINLDKSYFIFF